MTTYWENNDGLTVSFGPIETLKNVAAAINDEGTGGTLRVPVEGASITTGAVHPQFESGAYIPAGALIVSATLIVSVPFDSAGDAGTLDIGTYDEDGVAISADGIDADIAQGAIDAAGDVVVCNGALIGTVVAENSYPVLSYATAAFTAGEALLVIEYVK